MKHLLIIVLLCIGMAASAAEVTRTVTWTDPPVAVGLAGSGVVRIQCSADGGVTWMPPIILPTPVASWTGQVTFTVKEGRNTLMSRAWDAQGNMGSVTAEVVIDSSPPVGSIGAGIGP